MKNNKFSRVSYTDLVYALGIIISITILGYFMGILQQELGYRLISGLLLIPMIFLFLLIFKI